MLVEACAVSAVIVGLVVGVVSAVAAAVPCVGGVVVSGTGVFIKFPLFGVTVVMASVGFLPVVA
eukprot:10497515-Prorocentrum_lima.AAC.1